MTPPAKLTIKLMIKLAKRLTMTLAERRDTPEIFFIAPPCIENRQFASLEIRSNDSSKVQLPTKFSAEDYIL
jgi:hypothetical protein